MRCCRAACLSLQRCVHLAVALLLWLLLQLPWRGLLMPLPLPPLPW